MKPFHPLSKSELLQGVKALWWQNFKAQGADETRFEYLQRRMLRVILLTYTKHHLDLDIIGYEALSDELHNVICEVIGDDAFVAWVDRVKEEAAQPDIQDD